MKAVNSNFKFSFFSNLFEKQPEQTIDVNQLIEFVKYPYLKSEIEQLRSLDKEAYKREKLNLPAVTLSGVFKERKNSCLVAHSGLIQIDFDDIKEYNDCRTALIDDPYTFVLFRSPSGNGIKMLVKVNPSVETHKAQFLALEKYYLEEYNLEMDSGTKDVSRAMLLSYDSDLYCNPFSNTFEELLEEKRYKQKTAVVDLVNEPKTAYHTQNKIEGSEEQLAKKLCDIVRERNIDLTDSFHNWVRIGFILSNTFGEWGRNFFHQLSAQHQDYNFEKCDAKYSELLRDNNGGLSFGTLIFMARSHGIELFDVKVKHQQESKPKSKTGLREALKTKRLEIAKKNGKPAFTVFTNKVLEQLLEKLPTTKDELLCIKGIGEKKAEELDKLILPIIKQNTY